MISSQIICDSISSNGNRLTSWILVCHRYILSEINTIRMFSRNSASSRAIPSHKIIKAVKENPAIPVHWGKLQKGMQAEVEIDEESKGKALSVWLDARDNAVKSVEKMLELGIHKQIANRMLEPWMWQTILLSATDFENFFKLRAHKDAQPEFSQLAHLMLEQYNKNEPKHLELGQWHIPFGDKYCDNLTIDEQLKVCTARAARVSYNTFEGDIDNESDFKVHDKLLQNKHLSPFEHAAQNMENNQYYGNFKGWKQYRKYIPNENQSDDRVVKKEKCV